jgi:hypothetical protein
VARPVVPRAAATPRRKQLVDARGGHRERERIQDVARCRRRRSGSSVSRCSSSMLRCRRGGLGQASTTTTNARPASITRDEPISCAGASAPQRGDRRSPGVDPARRVTPRSVRGAQQLAGRRAGGRRRSELTPGNRVGEAGAARRGWRSTLTLGALAGPPGARIELTGTDLQQRVEGSAYCRTALRCGRPRRG